MRFANNTDRQRERSEVRLPGAHAFSKAGKMLRLQPCPDHSLKECHRHERSHCTAEREGAP
jgi:hypothetical protein